MDDETRCLACDPWDGYSAKSAFSCKKNREEGELGEGDEALRGMFGILEEVLEKIKSGVVPF